MKRESLLAILLLALALLGRSPSSASPTQAPADKHFALPATPQACSSFCLDNGDHCVFGTNQDNSIDAGLLYVNKRGLLKSGWDPSTSGQYARWISKYGSVTIVHAGYQMAWAGMNEAGLMISTMALGETRNPPPDERPPLVSSFWAQYQLGNHSTVEEVIASDAQIRVEFCSHGVGSVSGSGAAKARERAQLQFLFHCRKCTLSRLVLSTRQSRQGEAQSRHPFGGEVRTGGRVSAVSAISAVTCG